MLKKVRRTGKILSCLKTSLFLFFWHIKGWEPAKYPPKGPEGGKYPPNSARKGPKVRALARPSCTLRGLLRERIPKTGRKRWFSTIKAGFLVQEINGSRFVEEQSRDKARPALKGWSRWYGMRKGGVVGLSICKIRSILHIRMYKQINVILFLCNKNKLLLDTAKIATNKITPGEDCDE